MKSIILITGAARSGTSITAGIIDKHGVNGGELFPANASNKRGIYENIRARAKAKAMLKTMAFDPMCQKPLAEPEFFKRLPAQEIRKWREGLDVGYIKDPKMVMMWPLWDRSFPDAKWILVRRNDQEIIDSCLRTTFMHRYKDAAGWTTWLGAHKEQFEKMKGFLNIKEVWPQKIISGDYSEIKAVLEWLGLKMNSAIIDEFVSPALWGGKGKNG